MTNSRYYLLVVLLQVIIVNITDGATKSAFIFGLGGASYYLIRSLLDEKKE